MLPPPEPRGATTPRYRHRTSVSSRLSPLYRRQVGDIETANRVGNLRREVALLTKVLTGRGKHRGNIMPTKAADGKPLTESKHLLDAWQEFLGRKFTCADIPGAAYAPITADDDNDGEVTEEELESCLRVLHDNKAPGCDGIPIEAYRGSPAAKQEVFAIVRLMWQTEVIPPALVLGSFVMLYKKGPRDNFGNYRAIGLMCHSYKLLSMLVLHRMRDAVESRLAETQAGFRRERGCRDNQCRISLYGRSGTCHGPRALGPPRTWKNIILCSI